MVLDFVVSHVGLLYDLGLVIIALFLLILLGGILISRFDKMSLEESIYCAFSTAFKAGFGNLTPKSRGGKIIAICIAFLGIILMGVFVAIAVQSLETAMQ
jgi:voltage-gated potassium channel